MSKKDQAGAYLREARTTLEGARILFEAREERGFAQVVKNAYDALEQAISAGIACRGAEIPRHHPGKVETFFEMYDEPDLEEAALRWVSRRAEAQYVDFEGSGLSVPEASFDEDEAEAALEDAEAVVAFVASAVEGEG